MSLIRNTAANYLGQAYTTSIGILILPLYLRYLGAEAYGLIGFFVLVQSWMQLLDLGMTPTLSREVARLKWNTGERYRLITVVNSLETVFICISLVVGACLFHLRGKIASNWLTFEVLAPSTVSTALGVTAIIASIRWVSSINRSGINAYESQVWLNLADVCINTLRFPGSLVLVIWSDGNILLYFYYQLAISVIELVLIRGKFRGLLPSAVEGTKRFCRNELRRIAPFALSIGYTGAIWVLLSQLDKLLLSRVLSLSEYGYFTLVATIASGLLLISAPISKAILPRMTALLAQGNEQEMLNLYCKSTRFVVCIIAPITLVIALFPSEIVYIWTGNREASRWVKPILPLFILGNGLLTIGSFQYYLQYAHGKLRQHVIYNTVSVIISTPLIVYSAFSYGPLGVAWVWFIFRIISLLLWTPYIHHVFAPGIHVNWLLKDLLTPAISSSIFILGIALLVPNNSISANRFEGFLLIILIIFAAFTLAFLASYIKEIKERVRRYYAKV